MRSAIKHVTVRRGGGGGPVDDKRARFTDRIRASMCVLPIVPASPSLGLGILCEFLIHRALSDRGMGNFYRDSSLRNDLSNLIHQPIPSSRFI